MAGWRRSSTRWTPPSSWPISTAISSSVTSSSCWPKSGSRWRCSDLRHSQKEFLAKHNGEPTMHTVKESGTFTSKDGSKSTQLTAGDQIDEQEAIELGLISDKEA